jgi:DNA replication protein DnaC
MLKQPMIEKLHALRLHGMAEAVERQERDAATQELTFLDRLAMLVDHQWTWRENQALARRIKTSRLRGSVCVEDINYRAERGLSRSVIRALAENSAWVANHEHIFVLGPTGVGKSFVASALAQKACRDGYSAYFTRATALFRDLAMARADGSLRQFLSRLNRIDVLVVDDWAMAPMSEQERRDFWEITEDRYQTRSMILTSQLPVAQWHEQINDPTVADGILDRLVHNAHRIEMRGDSMRKIRGENHEK